MSNSTSLSNFEAIRLVAGRELNERLRAKSFFILTGLLVVIILAMGGVSRFAKDDVTATTIGIAGNAPAALAQAITEGAEQSNLPLATKNFGNSDEAKTALLDEDVDAVIVPADRQVLFAEDINEQQMALVQQAWSAVSIQQALVDSGLSPAQVSSALTVSPLEATVVSTDSEAPETSGVAVLTGTLAAILLFLSLQTFGNYVLMGVVEEKSTAVVEVLLARTKADQLLAGKIIGIGLAALLQFAIAIVAGLVALAIADIEVPSDVWSALPMALVWFLGGYAFYSTLFALAGSLVSRQEDAQAASAPIQTALIGAYLLVFVLGYQPNSTASTVMSFIPPLSPLSMPLRMASGSASTLEVGIALALLVLATIIAWKLASRIYEQVLLRRGSRISWSDAFSLLRRS